MKKVLFSLAVALAVVAGFGVPVEAEGGTTPTVDITVTEACNAANSTVFFFLRPWYYGLSCDDDGNILPDNFQTVDLEEGEGETNLSRSIKNIVLTIVYDIGVLVGVLATGFLIYGGYQYMMARGDSGKAIKGRKTITAAIVGLIIVLVANVGVNTAGKILMKTNTGSQATISMDGGSSYTLYNVYNVAPHEMIGATVQFVLALAAVVSIGFIIYSGITYMTSYGNPTKVEQAKKGIMYSVIGLVIVMLSFAIVNFLLGGLQLSMPAGSDTDLFTVISNLVSVVLGVAGFIAVAGIVVGGVYYMTANGDAQKVAKAKNTLLYSIVGLIVCLLSSAIVTFVVNKVF